ncbi:hypothetical protein GGP67_000491 [Salinibacter ruber]|nr:hypothetical protein [Salinibacter ruber]
MSRQGAPERSGLEDATRDLPVVVVRAAPALNLRQEGLDTLVLLVGEPEATASSGVEEWQNGSLGPKTYANRSYNFFIRQCLAPSCVPVYLPAGANDRSSIRGDRGRERRIQVDGTESHGPPTASQPHRPGPTSLRFHTRLRLLPRDRPHLRLRRRKLCSGPVCQLAGDGGPASSGRRERGRILRDRRARHGPVAPQWSLPTGRLSDFFSQTTFFGGGGYGHGAGPPIVGGEGYGLIAPSQGHQGREVSVGGGRRVGVPVSALGGRRPSGGTTSRIPALAL